MCDAHLIDELTECYQLPSCFAPFMYLHEKFCQDSVSTGPASFDKVYSRFGSLDACQHLRSRYQTLPSIVQKWCTQDLTRAIANHVIRRLESTSHADIGIELRLLYD